MSVQSDTHEGDLLVALQRGIPLTERPFADLGSSLGLAEELVLRRTQDLFDSGVARRFGAVFDSRSLGYRSTLCAVDVPGGDLERVAALLAPHPGVTHCYERDGRPNLWFTLTARSDRFENELQQFAQTLSPLTLLNLPATRRFKVEVVLDSHASGPVASPVRGTQDRGLAVAAGTFTETDRVLVRSLQGNLAITAEPFAPAARATGMVIGLLLDRLNEWKERGVLRRIGVILRHRQAGFVANGMCVWRVQEDGVEEAGRAISQAPEVTHCYERPCSADFPYNLYAMIHAREQQTTASIFQRLSRSACAQYGRIMMSVREFKKSSPVFFCEDAAGGKTA